MVDKSWAIKEIVRIQNGSGVSRENFPEQIKGEIAKWKWDNLDFCYGMEYGYILALLEIFQISWEELRVIEI